MGGGSSNNRRRPKAALFLLACGVLGGLPHGLGPLGRLLPPLGLAGLLGVYVVRTVFLRPQGGPAFTPAGLEGPSVAPLAQVPGPPPAVDVVVAARDEEAVIARLVERVLGLRWPTDQLRLWVIDDGSEDRTPQRLAELQALHPQLRVLRRCRDAGGGKSGALNLVLQQLQGRWLLVLDADADLQPDLLERLIPYAESGGWAAVQLRKAEVNAEANWLTRAQAMEMAFDAFIQEGRLARGG
ncbi:MAG: glycosyltransferase family 2 protein, partial [Cyanobacteria bacterium]|nr:glycosyltransferase family 2 protein [Cyanobacteriota bacterium]